MNSGVHKMSDVSNKCKRELKTHLWARFHLVRRAVVGSDIVVLDGVDREDNGWGIRVLHRRDMKCYIAQLSLDSREDGFHQHKQPAGVSRGWRGGAGLRCRAIECKIGFVGEILRNE